MVPPSPASADSGHPTALDASRHVLVADPAPGVQHHVASLLEVMGHDPTTVATLAEAVAVLRARPIDLLLVCGDYAHDGALHLLQALKQSPRHYALPVVLMLSSDAQRARYEPGVRQLLFDVVQKPVASVDLRAVIARVVEPRPGVGHQLTLGDGDEALVAKVIATDAERVVVESEGQVAPWRPGTLVRATFPMLGLGLAVWRVEVTGAGPSRTMFSLRAFLGRQEQRRHFRRTLDAPVRYRVAGDFYRLGQALDLSEGGLQLATTHAPVPDGTVVELGAVTLPEGRVLEGVAAEVRRCVLTEHGSQWGLAFKGLTEAQRRQIQDVVLAEPALLRAQA